MYVSFDAANDQTEGMDDIFERVFAVVGVKGSVTYVEPSNSEFLFFRSRGGSEMCSTRFSIRGCHVYFAAHAPISGESLAWLAAEKAGFWGRIETVL